MALLIYFAGIMPEPADAKLAPDGQLYFAAKQGLASSMACKVKP
jgi:hypothetical protein